MHALSELLLPSLLDGLLWKFVTPNFFVTLDTLRCDVTSTYKNWIYKLENCW